MGSAGCLDGRESVERGLEDIAMDKKGGTGNGVREDVYRVRNGIDAVREGM